MRRLQEKYNYKCKCGHVKRLHEGDDYSEWCVAAIRARGDEMFANDHCLCAGYQMDNLDYLEKKANEHKL